MELQIVVFQTGKVINIKTNQFQNALEKPWFAD
jgi:hypothetical protein